MKGNFCSGSSSDSEDSLSEGSYDTSENVVSDKCDEPTQPAPTFELTAPLKEACEVLSKHLLDDKADISNDKQVFQFRLAARQLL